jgi:hypothetical protein
MRMILYYINGLGRVIFSQSLVLTKQKTPINFACMNIGKSGYVYVNLITWQANSVLQHTAVREWAVGK